MNATKNSIHTINFQADIAFLDPTESLWQTGSRMMTEVMTDPAVLRAEILRLTREYSRMTHVGNRPAQETGEGAELKRPTFVPGTTIVPFAGRVFTEEEVAAAVGATLDF